MATEKGMDESQQKQMKERIGRLVGMMFLNQKWQKLILFTITMNCFYTMAKNSKNVV